MASTFHPPKHFLWYEEHASITAWMAKNDLGLEFYGSFLNYCARSMDKLRRVNNRLLKDHLGHLRDTLTREPLSSAAVLHEMQFYFKRFYLTGPVKSGAYPLNALLASPDHVHRAHHYLYNKVFSHRRGLPSPASASAIVGDTLAVVNGTSASASSPASSASPATPQEPGFLSQLSLPGGPLLSTLPIREQPLSVASLEASLPVVSAPSVAPASPEQERCGHGALLLLGGHEQEVAAEMQKDEGGGVKS